MGKDLTTATDRRVPLNANVGMDSGIRAYACFRRNVSGRRINQSDPLQHQLPISPISKDSLQLGEFYPTVDSSDLPGVVAYYRPDFTAFRAQEAKAVGQVVFLLCVAVRELIDNTGQLRNLEAVNSGVNLLDCSFLD